ncbi:hypothetical protein [Zhihengliuella halotolerans]|uniref:Uncharacterized protein n=1 Tax=Zhihengliuella halotolerans TaxID=370736 RepID=A0A4Q8AEJ2_9MICC|nr:hypothetical protein [Zhihengliuella halotolerans]RZU62648.1 hypothetical protein EV380_2246 [Zhihengliuella halotolerans]
MKLKNRPSKHSTVLPGGQILDRIMRLLVASVAAGLIYGLFTRATKIACVGGVNADGEYIDSSGNVIETTPSCLTLTLGPSGWVYLMMALTAIVLLSRAIQNSPNEATAVHLIRWAGMIVPTLAIASLVISMASFMLVRVNDWAPGDDFAYFVPFGSVELEINDSPVTSDP